MRNANKFFRSISFHSLLLIVFPFSILFVGFFHPINAITQDLGRHLLTGKIILGTHSVPSTNLYTYTYPSFPFINHHWLSEVLFYLLQTSVGFSGLLFTMVLIVLSTFGLLFKNIQKVVTPIVFASVSFILFPVLFERTDLRPEIFSFFFLSLFITILSTYRERPTRLLYILPFAQFLWANMHIYFFIGFLVLGLFSLDLIIRERFHLQSKKVITLLGISLLSFLASLLNPHGLTGLLYPLTVFQNYGYTVEENQNIFFLQSLFHKPTITFFELSVILLFICLLASKKSRLIDWLLTLSFTCIGAMAIRNFPLYVIAVFIPFCLSLEATYSRVFHLFSPFTTKRVKYLSLWSVLLLLLWLFVKTSNHPLSAKVDHSGAGAVAYFISNHLQGPIFNNFDIGSYLEYRLFPKEKTFVDGRPEAYPSSFFQKLYIPMQQDPAIFQKAQDIYHFRTILFSHTDQTPWGESFLGWITKNKTWKITYLDETMVVLQPSLAPQKEINDDPSVIEPYRQSLQSLLQLAHFYTVVGWPKSLKAALQAILLLDPNNCPAILTMTALMQQEQDPALSLFAYQHPSSCQ